MATIVALVDGTFTENSIKVTWTSLVSASLNGDPLPENFMDYSDRSIQVLGTFNGATVTMQGSNDNGTTWATVNDAFGVALTFTTAGIKQLTEVVAYMRPLVSASGASTDLTVVAVCRRPRSGQEG